MSKDKKKALKRRLELLMDATYVCPLRKTERGLWFHTIGGMSMHNKDVRWLIDNDMIKLMRLSSGRGYPLSPKKFETNFKRDHKHFIDSDGHERSWGLHGYVNRTRGFITEKGRKFLKEHSK